MAQQAQRMGARFLHQLTNLGGGSGNTSQDISTHSTGSNTSPVKNQLASLFQKGPPAPSPDISLPARKPGTSYDGVGDDASMRFGEAFSDGMAPHAAYQQRPLAGGATDSMPSVNAPSMYQPAFQGYHPPSAPYQDMRGYGMPDANANMVYAMPEQPMAAASAPTMPATHPPAPVPPAARDTSLDDSGMALRQGQPWTNTSPTKRMDPSEIDHLSRIYYMSLLQFFRSQAVRSSLLTPSRTNAREKLTRLNKQQFAELSTDVHDELQRRQDESQSQPYLQGRHEFHPKRNQARQKLATLPKNRFRDLASDVFFELERRYPELPQDLRHESLEELMGPREGQAPEGMPPAPDVPGPSVVQGGQDVVAPAADVREASGGTSPTGQALSPGPYGPQPVPVPVSVEPRMRSTEPTASRMSSAVAQQQLADLMADAQQMSSAQMFAPTRVSVAEEPAEPALPGTEPRSVDGGAAAGAVLATPGGVAAAASQRGALMDPAEVQASRDRVDLLQKQVQLLEEQERALRAQGAERDRALEELRSQNAQLQERLATLQQHVSEHERTAAELRSEHDRHLLVLSDKEAELRSERDRHRVVMDDKEAELLQHRANLDALRAQYNDLNLVHAARSKDVEAEAQWKRQLEDMQRETLEQQNMVQGLRSEVATLLEELRRLSARNDAMTTDKESDVAIIRDLHMQMSAYKRRYEGTKAELRIAQSASQVWAQPHVDEWKYVSPTGAVADTNLKSFQTSIDELLTTARSAAPSNVLIAMKTVVLSTTLVTDDIAKYESQPENELGALSAQQREDVETLKTSISDALTNLMNACRNHASSQGLAPVSLIDAAATHVAIAVVEVVKLLKLRRVPRPSEDDFSFESTNDATALSSPPSGLKPLHTRSALSPPAHSAPPLAPSSRRPSATAHASPVSLRSLSYSHSNLEARMRSMDMKAGLVRSPPPPPPAEPASTTPAAAGGSTARTMDVEEPQEAAAEQGVDTSREDDELENWGELRNYIEVQTEAIVHSIQSLLSALREGAQGVQLNENLTQITTIVSSIVAISRDHLPNAGTPKQESISTEAERIFAELTENCDRLSDMQSNTTFDRTAKSIMASASYGVAKGLKALNELLNAADEVPDASRG